MRVAWVAVLVLVAAGAGCINKRGDGDGPEGTSSGSSSADPAFQVPHNATLAADVVNGTAPLAVNFTMTASPGAASWRLSFGDGAFANGTGEPSLANHTYAVGGNFSAELTVVYAVGLNATSGLDVTVAVPTGVGLPEVTHFEFGESAGCVGDAHAQEGDIPLNCLSFQGGPDSSGIDGHWLALDERYWGLLLTTTMDEPTDLNHDSDCYFLAADEMTETGSGSNEGDPCGGIVPPGTAWLFLYPWGFPADGMTADFAAA